MLKLVLLVVFITIEIVYGGTKKKPHGHKGVIEAYDGKPLPLSVTADQSKKLDKGDAVVYNERTGKSGRGVVIQDVNATLPVVMGRIRDLSNYHKMVPHVKKVDVYETSKSFNGTSKTGAEFKIGLLGMRFIYYLMLTHEPKYNTLTWTLDYRYNSDFDDNVGHWQVASHPTKKGWTRVLYSCKIKLFSWIPEFVVKFLTTKALVESTGWVKKESELEQKRLNSLSRTSNKDSSPNWMNLKGGYFQVCNVMQDIQINCNRQWQTMENDIRRGSRRALITFNPKLRSFFKPPTPLPTVTPTVLPTVSPSFRSPTSQPTSTPSSVPTKKLSKATPYSFTGVTVLNQLLSDTMSAKDQLIFRETLSNTMNGVNTNNVRYMSINSIFSYSHPEVATSSKLSKEIQYFKNNNEKLTSNRQLFYDFNVVWNVTIYLERFGYTNYQQAYYALTFQIDSLTANGKFQSNLQQYGGTYENVTVIQNSYNALFPTPAPTAIPSAAAAATIDPFINYLQSNTISFSMLCVVFVIFLAIALYICRLRCLIVKLESEIEVEDKKTSELELLFDMKKSQGLNSKCSEQINVSDDSNNNLSPKANEKLSIFIRKPSLRDFRRSLTKGPPINFISIDPNDSPMSIPRGKVRPINVYDDNMKSPSKDSYQENKGNDDDDDDEEENDELMSLPRFSPTSSSHSPRFAHSPKSPKSNHSQQPLTPNPLVQSPKSPSHTKVKVPSLGSVPSKKDMRSDSHDNYEGPIQQVNSNNFSDLFLTSESSAGLLPIQTASLDSSGYASPAPSPRGKKLDNLNSLSIQVQHQELRTNARNLYAENCRMRNLLRLKNLIKLINF